MSKTAIKRRKRTTKIFVVVETTINDVANLLKLSPGTVGARYHRIKDKHPRSAVLLSALSVSHKRKEIRDAI